MPSPPTGPAIDSLRAQPQQPTSRGDLVASYVLGATLFGVWTWWALSDGAFFGTVLLPGAALLYVVLAMTIGLARPRIAIRGPHAVAFAGLLGLATWTALSLLWSPAQDLAFDYAQRAFVYAAAFALGLMLAISLRQRMILAIAPLLGAGAVVTLVTLIRIWAAGDVGAVVDIGGTLDFPFGYRNANAGFFVMVGIGSLGLAARPRSGIGIRAAATTLAAASLALGAVSQSRGSLIAVVAGAIALIAVSPWRGRALIALGIAAVPLVALFPELLDPYEARDTAVALDELQGAALAAVAAGAIAGALGVAWALLERRGVRVPVPRPNALVRRLAIVAAILAVAGGVVVAGKNLDDSGTGVVPSGGTSSSPSEGSRFTYAGGLNREDFWRVSLLQVGDDPLLGGGAGSFRPRYLLDRDTQEEPRNAHSVWLETLGELGVVGFLFLVVALGAAGLGALRSRRLGPESAALSTIALAVAAAWVAQASVDWSWYFGALTAPAIALLGAAAAPAALSFEPPPRRLRVGIGAGAVVLALLALPTFAAERLTLSAAQGWRGDLDGAYGALATASDLNPFADTPSLVEAEIARQNDDIARASAALLTAQERDPEDWRVYLIGATLLQESAPEAALEQAISGLALNPRSEELQSIRASLEAPG